LTSCGTTPETKILREVQVERLQVPPSLLDCAPSPAPPSDGTQRDVARYVVDLWQAHQDCRGKVKALRGLVGG
jgi:hypothetical protein